MQKLDTIFLHGFFVDFGMEMEHCYEHLEGDGF